MSATQTRFAIVTGAAAGIGRATTEILLSDGWRVGAFDLDDAALRAMSASLATDQMLVQSMDVADEAGWASTVAAFGEWSGGRLHLLVNNAGIISVGSFADTPAARMRRLIDINVVGVINGTKACLPLLSATRGHIVNVSSIAALTGWPYAAAYSASKAAVHNLTEALAAELAPAGIVVSEVLPGFVATQLIGDEAEIAALRTSFRALKIAFTSPARIARAIVAAADSGSVHHIVGRQSRVYAFVTRYLPGLGRLMTHRLAARYGRALDEVRQRAPGP